MGLVGFEPTTYSLEGCRPIQARLQALTLVGKMVFIITVFSLIVKGATSTIHYVPLIVITAISGILMMMLSTKLGALISNPEVFLEPAIESASRDIALVCDGKLSKKTLSPPPPGAYYLIMNCKDRQDSEITSNIYLATQLYDAAKGIKDVIKGLSKTGKDLLRLGDEMSVTLRKEGALTKKLTENGEVILELTTDTAESLSDIGKRGEKTVDLASSTRKSADDITKGGKRAESTSATVAKKEEKVKSTSGELQKLGDMPSENGKVSINCKKNKELCDAITYGTIRYQSAGNAMEEASRAYKATTDTAENIFDTKSSAKLSVKNEDIIRRSKSTLSEFVDSRAALRAIVPGKDFVRIVGRKALIWKAAFQTRRTVIPRLRKLLKYPKYADINAEFLDEHAEFYDVLTGNFVGIKYTPYMVNIVNFTTDEEKDGLLFLYNKSLNSTGAALQMASAVKESASTNLGTFGYYETINYFESLESDKVIVVNQETNLDAGAYVIAATEFGLKSAKTCKGEACANIVLDIINKSYDVAEGFMTYQDFTSYVSEQSNSEIQNELETFKEVLKYLNQINEFLKPFAEELTTVQLDTASWLKDNCETSHLNYGSDYQVEVATCGMVLDCSPGNYCYMGIPVVNADPWIPYVPVGIIDEQNVDTISNVIGLNYDSSQRIVNPGAWTGCGGSNLISKGIAAFNPDTYQELFNMDFSVPIENKVYICAMTSYAQRCKIVACDKYVKTKANNFVPTPTIEDTGDNILIGGNFATW